MHSLSTYTLIFLAFFAFPISTYSQENKGPAYRLSSKRKPSDPGFKIGRSRGNIPKNVTEIAQKGAEAMAKKNFKEARIHYLEMIKLDPENPLAYANLGVAEFYLKNLTAAEGLMTKSLHLDPSYSRNWTTLGIIQLNDKNLLMAISSLTRAVSEDPTSSQAYLYLAAATYEKGWTNAAIENLSRVVELEPKNADAQYNLALTYFTQNPPKIELARRHYYNAIDLGAPKSEMVEKRLKESK